MHDKNKLELGTWNNPSTMVSNLNRTGEVHVLNEMGHLWKIETSETLHTATKEGENIMHQQCVSFAFSTFDHLFTVKQLIDIAIALKLLNKIGTKVIVY